MRFTRFLASLAVASLLPPLAAQAEEVKATKIAVMELRAEAGVTPGVRDLLYERLLREVEKVGGHEVLGRTDIESMLGLEAERQKLGCFDDSSCIAEIGGALGVRYILTGNLGRIGESMLFNMKRIDVDEAKAVGRVSRRIKGGTEESLLDELPSIVAELFGKEAEPAQTEEAEKPKGELTTEAPDPGAAEDGPGASTQSILGWVALGVGAAAVAAGAGLGGFALAEQSSLGESKFDEDKYDDTLSKIDNSALAADVLLAVGGAAALTGLLLVLLDGGSDEGEPEPATAGVSVELQAGPGVVGLKGRF